MTLKELIYKKIDEISSDTYVGLVLLLGLCIFGHYDKDPWISTQAIAVLGLVMGFLKNGYDRTKKPSSDTKSAINEDVKENN